LGQFRVYCIARSDAQIVAELHLFDVKSVSQSDPLTDPLLVESKGENGLLLSLRCASSAAYDAFLHRFALSYRENLPQLPKFAACKFRVDKRRFPPDLDRHLQLGPCGGFVRSYECCCAFYNVVPRPDVCWTVDNLWAFNGVREFNMLEFDTLDRAHVKAVIFALRYNDWFDSFVLSDAAMPSGAWSALASCLAINQRFARLELSCVADLPKQSLAKLFAAMHENRACAIAELDISRNTLEPRDVSALALLLSSRLALQALSLNRCTLPSKSMVTIVNALTDDQQHGVARHLRLLDLSHGNLAAAGASTSLGRALAVATQLDTLMLSYAELRCTELLAAAPSPFASISQLNVRGCRDPTLTRFVRAFTNVRNLDISETLLSAADVCALLRPSGGATKIVALACSGMAESWSEQDVLDVLAAIGAVTSTLRRLEFDCNFLAKPKSAALRTAAIEALCRCMGTATVAFGAPHDDDAGGDADGAAAGLHALSVRGDATGRCAGASLLPLLLSLAGTTLRELDVRANALGDDGAAALARALQANASLRRLAFDNNGITLVGFRRLLDALERNFSLTDLTLPVIDGAAMMLKAQADAVGGAGLSLASTAASRFEQRSAPNVLAELHAIVMRNVQLTVLDATRKGKSAALPMRPRTRSHRAVVRPNGNSDGAVGGDEDDDDELRVDLGGAARRDTTSVRVATPPTAARTRARAPSSRASAKPPKVAAVAAATASSSSTTIWRVRSGVSRRRTILTRVRWSESRPSWRLKSLRSSKRHWNRRDSRSSGSWPVAAMRMTRSRPSAPLWRRSAPQSPRSSRS
jgi:Ran GTPase-activating protein (RanGAP) involved in mRNA processing and transport